MLLLQCITDSLQTRQLYNHCTMFLLAVPRNYLAIILKAYKVGRPTFDCDIVYGAMVLTWTWCKFCGVFCSIYFVILLKWIRFKWSSITLALRCSVPKLFRHSLPEALSCKLLHVEMLYNVLFKRLLHYAQTTTCHVLAASTALVLKHGLDTH